MIETLFEEITGLPNDEAGDVKESENSYTQKNAEDSVIAALPIVRAIVNRKVISSWQSDASDLVQGITLRLLKWRDKYSEKSEKMSPDEWESFAARTAYNEVNRYFTTQKPGLRVPIEKAISISGEKSAEGQTELEFISLASLVWQNICSLTLRQRRALLLNSQELIIYLLKAGVDDDEMKRVLEFDRADWDEIKSNLPLTDAQIARLIQKKSNNGNLDSMTRSIKKGRHEARKKMRRLMDK
jgi:DNA-directed RNA polymerase specialized sigma24 family protein